MCGQRTSPMALEDSQGSPTHPRIWEEQLEHVSPCQFFCTWHWLPTYIDWYAETWNYIYWYAKNTLTNLYLHNDGYLSPETPNTLPHDTQSIDASRRAEFTKIGYGMHHQNHIYTYLVERNTCPKARILYPRNEQEYISIQPPDSPWFDHCTTKDMDPTINLDIQHVGKIHIPICTKLYILVVIMRCQQS